MCMTVNRGRTARAFNYWSPAFELSVAAAGVRKKQHRWEMQMSSALSWSSLFSLHGAHSIIACDQPKTFPDDFCCRSRREVTTMVSEVYQLSVFQFNYSLKMFFYCGDFSF